jgi:hypothetical protein
MTGPLHHPLRPISDTTFYQDTPELEALHLVTNFRRRRQSSVFLQSLASCCAHQQRFKPALANDLDLFRNSAPLALHLRFPFAFGSLRATSGVEDQIKPTASVLENFDRRDAKARMVPLEMSCLRSTI